MLPACRMCATLQEAADYSLVQMVRLSIKTGGAGQVSEGACWTHMQCSTCFAGDAEALRVRCRGAHPAKAVENVPQHKFGKLTPLPTNPAFCSCAQTVCGALRHNTRSNMTGICSIIPLSNCCEPAVPVGASRARSRRTTKVTPTG